MKEDIFFRVGYSKYLGETKKQKWTSKMFEKIEKHKFAVMTIFIILVCTLTNICLMYRFFYVLSKM